MKSYILYALAVACSFLSTTSLAQTNGNGSSVLSIERNKKDNTPKQIDFSGTANLHRKDAQKIFELYSGVKDEAVKLQLISTTATKQSTVVDRYAEYYKGIKVDRSSFTLTSKDDKVSFLVSNIYNVPKGSSTLPGITEEAALKLALNNIGAEVYAWQDPGMEKMLQKSTGKADTSNFPKGTLVWMDNRLGSEEQQDRVLHLAYCFNVYAKKPLSRDMVYVDAATGKILFVNSLLHNVFTTATASGASLYSGTVSLGALLDLSTGTYYLQDRSRAANINTFDCHNTTGSTITDITSASSTYTTDVGLDAHWGAGKVYDYWSVMQGRASFDNANKTINSYVHYDVNYNNAFWDGTEMIYGDGSGIAGGGFSPLAALDVCAHEIGHAVCQYTANLDYEKESGAMNEGFSDIWGAVIENYADPHETDAVAKSNYKIGEEISSSGLRSMSNPNSFSQPDTYGGTSWFNVVSCTPTTGNDHCGVHRNSGVLNFWFYLLAQGGSGTNDVGNSYSVTGIGMSKAANIAYGTELVLTNTSDYAACRAASISVATTLYGSCAAEVIAVTKAWYAVGVGANFTGSVPGAITGTTNVCQSNTTALTNATSGGTWTTASTSVATVVSGTGVVTGASAGTTTITFTVTSNGCYVTTPVTVNALPSAISGTTSVCVSSTTTLSDAGGGTWSTSATVASVASGTGVVTGNAAGTATITYKLSTGCQATTIVTVNPLPSAISGTTSVCVSSTTALTDAGGGTWSTAATVASVGLATGIVSGTAVGTATITYILGTGCQATTIVTVNPLPSAITGTGAVCPSTSLTLSDAGGGTWSTAATVVTVVPATGLVTGVAAGTATITYKLSTGCQATTIVTVNPSPSAITGTTKACPGTTTALTDAGGGTWTTAATVASVAGTGVVTGIAPGTATITYTLGTGCTATTVVTINPLPSAITGSSTVCVLANTTLSDAGGGTWTSANTTVSVGLGTGIVTGAAAGTATITYTLGTGCLTTTVMTVNPLPGSITGTGTVCVGLTTALTDAGGGTWSTANTTASVALGTGVVTGNASGTATITYALGTGCTATTIVTVNPLPGAITGTTSVCIGSTTALTDAGGGTWSSSSTAASVSGVGVVTGLLVGTSTITYTLSTGCLTTRIVTVNALPGAITGTPEVCVGLTTALTDAGGGAWTTGATVATVGAGTGIVTGVAAGTAVITYTLGVGCATNITVTVDPLPAAITGTQNVCVGLTTALTNATAGGAWTSSNTNASVGGTGIVTGAAAGTATITYKLTVTGCQVTAPVTVNPLPGAITGTQSVCIGLTTALTDAGGGAWTTSATVATVGAGSGVVTGVAAGTAVITYTLGTGCQTTTVVTVNPLPAAISGPATVCAGLTTTLSDAGGGAWSTAATVASVVSGTGVVTGVAAGTAVITYTLPVTGCIAVRTVTINPLPAAITGTQSVCIGLSTTLSDAGGGTWTSSTSSVATIGSSSGVVTGVALGTSVITYMLSTGCQAIATVTVNSLPVTITGTQTVCVGATTALSNAGGGTWSSGNTTVSVGLTTGVVNGLATGTATVTYTAGAGCTTTAVVTVNPLPAAISGTLNVCAGLTTSLTDAGGGTWASSNTTVATVGGTGVVSGSVAGTTSITYTLPTGCTTASTITVNPLPAAISGTTAICAGSSAALTDAGGGTWTSSTSSVATVGLGTGIVNALIPGSSTITYTLGTGCITTTAVTVSVIPAAITGTQSVCVGLFTTLSDAVGGGSWTSTNTNIAVGSGTGLVAGLSAGTASVTYSVGPGCATSATVTVNPLPAAISGVTNVCAGLTTALTDAGGGTWFSSATAIATVSGTGVVSGILAGTTAITYTLPTGCITTTTVTVNPLPSAITGTAQVCAGLTTALTDAGGGAWSSGSSAVATVGAANGIVNGVLAGTATITYTLGTGCITTQVVTVNPLPAAISGITNVCAGLTTALTDAGGGSWGSSTTTVATVGAGTGIVSGVLAGTTTITYTLPTGCLITTPVTVNPLPAAISGTKTVCEGLSTALTDAGGGTWTSSTSSIATIGGGTGIVNGLLAGTSTITYTLGTGCIITTVVTVNPLPAAISGATVVCEAATTSLTDAGGGTWTSSNTGIATAGVGTGIVSGVAFGTTTITYTLSTGCIATTLVTVNPLPLSITGTAFVCEGLTTPLADATPLGVWSSSNSTVATIAGTGVVSGILAGTSTISYALSATGCYVTRTATVNPLPSAITGTFTVCPSLTAALTDAGGGTWTSSNTAAGTIGLTTGIVTGVAAGTTTITYTLPTGCIALATFTVNGLPVVPAITGTINNICAGFSLSVSDALAGGVWSSDNTSIATVSGGTVTGAAAGTANISYAVTNVCGTTAPTYAVTVNALPIVLAMTGSPDVCIGLTSAMSDATPSGVWTSTNTTVATVNSVGVVTGLVAGTTTISYTVTSSSGCVTAASTMFTVHPPLSITATPASSTSFCTGGYVTLRSTTGSGFLYQWQVGGADITGATTSSYTANYSGNFTIVVTGSGICKSVSPVVSVTVSPSPIIAPGLSITASPDTVLCVTTSPVTYTPVPVNGGSTPVYQWYVNGVPTATGGTFTYSPASGDKIGARMTSNATCVFPDTAISSLNMLISPILTPAVSISASPGDEVCAGTIATYTAITSVGGTVPKYSWNKNGINVATGPSYSYTPVNGDLLICTLTSNFQCVTSVTATNSMTVIVDTYVVNKATIKALHAYSRAGVPDTFTVSAPHGGLSPAYQWYVNSVAVVGATSPMFVTTSLVDGQTVSCAVTSSELCAAPGTATSNTIKIREASEVKTIGGMNNFRLVPNPNKGTFTISGTLKGNTDNNVTIVMTNVLGQTVYTQLAQAHSGELSERITLSNTLANGMYIVNLTSGEDNVVFHVVLDR